MVRRFGEFELDTRSRQLRRRGRTVHVQPRVFELLCYLVANPDRAISRDELLERIWPGVSVEGGSLTRAMRGVRAALRADRSVRGAVQTMRGFGYRFAALVDPVREAASGATWKEPTRPFVGREAALARLEQAAQAVREGERRVVTIVGKPGSGKSALARRGLALARPGFLVGEGQCLQGFGSRTPYLALLEALSNLGREERGRGVLREAIRRAAPSWMPHLPALFDDAESALPAVGLQQDQMVREIIDALELAARETSVALFLEDLHWADRSTLALVGALARRSVPARLLILCTARSTELAHAEALRELRTQRAGARSARQPASRSGATSRAPWRSAPTPPRRTGSRSCARRSRRWAARAASAAPSSSACWPSSSSRRAPSRTRARCARSASRWRSAPRSATASRRSTGRCARGERSRRSGSPPRGGGGLGPAARLRRARRAHRGLPLRLVLAGRRLVAFWSHRSGSPRCQTAGRSSVRIRRPRPGGRGPSNKASCA